MKIVKIEDAGEKHTWDIEVIPQHHYLLSNGCVSHNTLSLLANCSSGIEPLYSREFTKTILDGYQIDIGNRYVGKQFKTALDISPLSHIDVQSAFQKYCGNSISKTINMSEDKSIGDIEDAFMYAWEQKCRGITIFRENSKQGVLQRKELAECNSDRCSTI